MATGAADDSLMDLDNPQDGPEIGVTKRPQPTEDDFGQWSGLALQFLDSSRVLSANLDWLEYQPNWPVKRGAPKKEAKDRLELFGQQVGLIVNALAAHYEISQSVAWGYTNILRKEGRDQTDYNVYKAWRAMQLRDKNGGKAGKHHT
jgi:predicted metal-dependent hydrolase